MIAPVLPALLQLQVYNVDETTWSDPIEPPGDVPGLAFHAAGRLGDYMLVTGGSRHEHGEDEMCYSDLLVAYSVKCNTWTTRTVGGYVASARP